MLAYYTKYYTKSVFSAFNLDYYTEVLDLKYLLEHLSDDPFFKKYKKLNEALIGVIEDYSLVSFVPLNIQVCNHYFLTRAKWFMFFNRTRRV